MSIPKHEPCPKCGSGDHLAVYRYDNNIRHVECDKPGCHYLGPGETSVRKAINRHNEAARTARP